MYPRLMQLFIWAEALKRNIHYRDTCLCSVSWRLFLQVNNSLACRRNGDSSVHNNMCSGCVFLVILFCDECVAHVVWNPPYQNADRHKNQDMLKTPYCWRSRHSEYYSYRESRFNSPVSLHFAGSIFKTKMTGYRVREEMHSIIHHIIASSFASQRFRHCMNEGPEWAPLQRSGRDGLICASAGVPCVQTPNCGVFSWCLIV